MHTHVAVLAPSCSKSDSSSLMIDGAGAAEGLESLESLEGVEGLEGIDGTESWSDNLDQLLSNSWVTSPPPDPAPQPSRPQRSVAFVDIEHVSLAVVPSLQLMGFTAVEFRDRRPLPAAGLFASQWAGRPRQAVAKEIAQQWCPHVRVEKLQHPSAVVVGARLGLDPVREQMLVERGDPFLPVVAMDDGFDVGPWVTGHNGPCATCLALHYQDLDQTWLRSVLERSHGDYLWCTDRSALAAVAEVMNALSTFDGSQPTLPPGVVAHIRNDGHVVTEQLTVHPHCPWHTHAPMG